MDLTYEIEYKDENEIKYLQVYFEADVCIENDGIGCYEFWGYKGFDRGHNYVTLDGDPVWDERLYTDAENRIIKEFRKDAKKWGALCNAFCEEYSERCSNY